MHSMPKLRRAFMAGRPPRSTWTPRQPTGAAPNHVRALDDSIDPSSAPVARAAL
ncbi:hypothetical protein [Mycobacterium canetti]|uniref:Uncharacterized protein n=2 Tax=Mycobacterium canetti TaxID=78331 RepID=A0ABV1MA05_9MYCO|nr:hypothetical protein [Mycobacterium canetti]MBA2788249.1 hypothetical protein [Mycobacterium canetti]CCC45956.1 hypothetical protein MCAN_36251 [Mycobacterium canettii CIPT 140010059]